MTRILLATTSDLALDQRMLRICRSLHKAGYSVKMIGRNHKDAMPLSKEDYQQHRIHCFFQKGKWMYMEFNIRLFFYLIFQRFDLICATDLDTIIPVVKAGRWKNKPIIYDAHEYFTEIFEVVSRPRIQRMWKRIEQKYVPKVNHAYTVNKSIQELFEQNYDISFGVIRNLPYRTSGTTNHAKRDYMIFQGHLNKGRGLRQLIRSMDHIELPLYFAGKGDLYEELVELTNSLQLQDKVQFLGFLDPDELNEVTKKARIGFNLYEEAGLNNRLSLNNKFFNYLRAGVPVISTNYPEYRRIKELKEYLLTAMILIFRILYHRLRLIYSLIY